MSKSLSSYDMYVVRFNERYALKKAPHRSEGAEGVLLQKILSSSNLRRFIPKSLSIKAAQMANPFKWRHYQSDIILLCVRWYLRYALSYRDLEEMMTERGLSLDQGFM